MDSFLNQAVLDIASISSILGLVVTLFILTEARKIRKSFLRRARIPEITKELNVKSKNISKGLKSWDTEKNTVNEQYSVVRGLLENISKKLPEDEKLQVEIYINSLKTRKYLFLMENLVIEDEDQAWKLYAELSRIITRLEQLQKDSKWD